MPAVITVTSLADDLAPNGEVTLREAVHAAELDVSVDGSTAGNGDDLIQFAAGLSGNIDLKLVEDIQSGPSALAISTSITIRGPAQGVAIQRVFLGPLMRLFRVGETGQLRLESLTLSRGVHAPLTDPLPFVDGDEARGGAILNEGTLEIVDSTLVDNRARGGDGLGGGQGGSGRGGAIYNDGGTVSIVNSTLSGNIAESGTGGSMPSSFGGGVFSRNGSLSIFNSTITSNSSTAGRGVYVLGDNAAATAEIVSTIIGQTDSVASQTEFVATEINDGISTTSGHGNLIRRSIGFSGSVVSTDDPRLGPLAPNGGPTWTHALAADSPAINEGDNPLDLATDQRGGSFLRVVDDMADIGAYERDDVIGPALAGDYNDNDVVDAADYVVWRKTRDTTVTPFEGADGNGDGQIGDADYNLWQANFGRTLPAAAAGRLVGPLPMEIAVEETSLAVQPAGRAGGQLSFASVSSRSPMPTKLAKFSPRPLHNALRWELTALLLARDGLEPAATDAIHRGNATRDARPDATAVDRLMAVWAAVAEDLL